MWNNKYLICNIKQKNKERNAWDEERKQKTKGILFFLIFIFLFAIERLVLPI